LSLQLLYQKPLDWNAMLRFLAIRATPDVEEVVGNRYAKTITVGGQTGTVIIQPEESSSVESSGFLLLTVHAALTNHIFEII